VLQLIAGRRDPESFVAGGTPINRDGPRYSSDIDIFHEREERVSEAAETDAAILRASGLQTTWTRRQPGIQSLKIQLGDEETKVEWVADTDYRFFPVVPDAVFGYVLQLPDLAVNKLMAAAGRREPRDLVDLITIHRAHLHIGAIAWAAVDVSPGFTPEGLIAEVRRNARYSKSDFADLELSEPIDPDALMRELRVALDEAEAFMLAMPSDKAGLLFLQNGKPVMPDPRRLGEYEEHRAQRRGHWPSSSEIGSAMLERYAQKPEQE
jgi:hypothetical protein